MRHPRFTTQPVEAEFFATASFRISEVFEVQRPAAEVWAELTADNPLAWCRILQRITWTSPQPFGVGTTRTARALLGTNVLDERFFRWEEGRRQSFYVLETTTPLFRRFAEDYLVEPTSEASCRFTWTIAAEPRSVARLANPANRWLLGTLLKDTRRHYRVSSAGTRGADRRAA